jgi:regulator of RNase E activity RraA
MPPDRGPAEWEELATATVADNVPEAIVLDPGLGHLAGPPTLAGAAWTARTGAGGYAAVREAIASAPPGSVLVLAGEGDLGRAIWGEVSTALARSRGVAGVIVDGAVRDLAAIAAGELAIYARGTTPRGPAPEVEGEVGGTVQCAGARIAPADLVLADADGIVVVPAAARSRGLALARAGAERERARLVEIGGAL